MKLIFFVSNDAGTESRCSMSDIMREADKAGIDHQKVIKDLYHPRIGEVTINGLRFWAEEK